MLWCATNGYTITEKSFRLSHSTTVTSRLAFPCDGLTSKTCGKRQKYQELLGLSVKHSKCVSVQPIKKYLPMMKHAVCTNAKRDCGRKIAARLNSTQTTEVFISFSVISLTFTQTRIQKKKPTDPVITPFI
jgi:hypothetical protein